MGKKLTTEIFIERSNIIHNNKYVYTETNYIDYGTAVNIICPQHGIFIQKPVDHLAGCGCTTCSGNKKSNTDEFIIKANIVHNNIYNYTNVIYINNKVPINIICATHGIFTQIPNDHLTGYGCNKCYIDSKKLSNEEFITKAQLIHGDTYDYTLINYIKINECVTIICKIHGEFKQKPGMHFSGSGCPRCKYNAKRTTLEFIEQAQLIHGDTYDYTSVNYINSNINVDIICSIHGPFKQSVYSHLQGLGCYKCCKQGYSNISIQWLESIMQEQDIFIQHAGNAGEYKIKTTRYRADGFHKKSNTIYEFHGDRFHGNPNIFESHIKCNPFNNLTSGELLQKTNQREQIIKDLGYNLVVIWESDYRNSIKGLQ